MHFLQAAAFALGATSLISSSVALPMIEERNLCTVKPSILKYLSKSGPLTRISSGDKNGGKIELGASEFIIGSGPASWNSTYEVRTAMKFDIPAGATGCRLQVSNKPTRIFKEDGQIDTSVYRVTDVVASNDWNNQPAPLPSQPNKVAQWNWEGSQTNLWAGNCDSNLSFLFKYSDWQTQGGTFHFLQAMESNNSDDGFTIIYDC